MYDSYSIGFNLNVLISVGEYGVENLIASLEGGLYRANFALNHNRETLTIRRPII
jgi:hypothetical protein